ncbi:hydroxymethylpyrimidine/phosphomethylpyrimidine kinase [Marinigracilibium pacificum]|uniref:hydroxymethylpyrimidine kinase n=1 Tax=Marinigracilibium pacificum TaxID=2729599 RepID=A0A848IX33_9BACT|nr:hydroxymethylpyrimidine/phosphomethylpyrimidine kinase [Marinigracilibium pacificum]NMM47728.1 hydroxymethylpyrimidine/phosphomethylpyrimidine kinase [Marinigracilibium pacificum]
MKEASNRYILSIAGLDPSAGAGLTSDIKTFEAFGNYGLSVCTSVTIQNDIDFKASHWVETNIILDQIDILFDRFTIEVVKIGVVRNWDTLATIVDRLKIHNPAIKIILDPILKASAGYEFNENSNSSILDNILQRICMITPNYQEIQLLYPAKTIRETIAHITRHTNLYLKGGHNETEKGTDVVYINGKKPLVLSPRLSTVYEKHGSGCVLSSALAASIASGLTLEDSSRKAKQYTEQFLASNQGLLGTHQSFSLQKHSL